MRNRNMASSGINWRAPLHMGATTTEVPYGAIVATSVSVACHS